MSGDTEGAVEGGRGLTLDDVLKGLGIQSEVLMEVLELLTALLMVVLFAIGVFDLGLKLYQLIASGRFTDPDAILKLIDTALLLLIIVEIYRTVISYVEDLNILPIVINVGLIAMARKIISFRTGKYGTKEEALLAAAAYGFLMLILVASFYLMHRSQQRSDFDIYSVADGE
ncbi:phosphate-starvation-inducible PsiE family protein [Halorarius halobius]|uniref:phosphate-starvation-inducible PsiE family protein n=1 Tax=Halorarius halobius TaxID=2962671 RepID=UPI0020CC4899|nr:phosphate-starvation-inducible PsiE family protein [Halorarius halobius]